MLDQPLKQYAPVGNVIRVLALERCGKGNNSVPSGIQDEERVKPVNGVFRLASVVTFLQCCDIVYWVARSNLICKNVKLCQRFQNEWRIKNKIMVNSKCRSTWKTAHYTVDDGGD